MMAVADPVIVVKIGGSTLGNQDTTLDDLVALQRRSKKVVVVHGGGKVISQWVERQGTIPRFVRGLRVTDEASLQIVTAVLTGLVNKEMVAAVIALGGRAMGLSGVDGGLLQAQFQDPELGYVGKVVHVDTAPIEGVLGGGYIPFVAPVGLHRLDGSDMGGCLLNINADIAAGEIAVALKAERLLFLTDVEGVLDNSGGLIPRVFLRQGWEMLRSGVIKGGMLPKLEACLVAAEQGVKGQVIDGRKPEALRRCLEGEISGTLVD